MSPPIDQVNQLRAEHAAGLPPVPNSAYLPNCSPNTRRHYATVIRDIARSLNNARMSQADGATLLADVATSLNNAFGIMSDATKSQEEVANFLIVAATLLTDAAEKSQSNNMANLFINAAAFLANAATSPFDTAKLLGDAAESLNIAATSAANENYEIVFIYDVEEITMLSRNYVAEFASKFPKIALLPIHNLVERVTLGSGFSGYTELLEGDVVNIEDAVNNGTEKMRKFAPKYNALRQFYDDISNGIRDDGPIINDELIDKCQMSNKRLELRLAAKQLQQKLHNRWWCMKQCLELVDRNLKKHANVVISGQGVGLAAAQLLVSKNAPFIHIENVFSTAKTSKEAVFNRIQRRFGKECILVYVTSPQTSYVPQMPRVRIWPVEGADSIELLYNTKRHIINNYNFDTLLNNI